MEIDAKKLYEVALEQCMVLQQQVVELKTLYISTKEELDKIKTKTIEVDEK